ncbi:MAG: tail fiber domain-containing protein [Planctomycetota bacterium]
MKTGLRSMLVGVFCALLAIQMGTAVGAPLGTAFTYQGRLIKNSSPIGNPSPVVCDMTFGLWDASVAGNQVGTSPVGPLPISVANGLFTTNIDFGPDAINGQARWLEIAVQCPGDASATILTPRQELKPAPYSHFSAAPWRTEDSNVYYANGFVGIGTSTPGPDQLDIRGDAPYDGSIRLENTQSGSGAWRIQSNGGVDELVFCSITDAQCHLYIKQGGNVGIGRTTTNLTHPGQGARALTLHGGSSGSTADAALALLELNGLNSVDTVSDTGQIHFLNNGISLGSISGGKSGADNLGFIRFVVPNADATDAVEAMRIKTPGNVGIGRTPGTNRLEVEGDASKTTAGSWLANSDAAIKQQVQPVKAALAVIDQLRPVAFYYTDEYRAKHPSVKDQPYFNYIAQEFRKVFPDSVQDSGEDGLLQMDSYPANVYAVAAIKELHDIVQEKDCEMEELKQRNDALEARLAKIEAMFAGQNASKVEGGQ